MLGRLQTESRRLGTSAIGPGATNATNNDEIPLCLTPNMRKRDFTSLDSAIVETLPNRPFRRDELLGVPTVRDQALRLDIRRSGVSRGGSADTTIRERLQALRQRGRVTYDLATTRWCLVNLPIPEVIRDTADAMQVVRGQKSDDS